jgi:hypothetical protein
VPGGIASANFGRGQGFACSLSGQVQVAGARTGTATDDGAGGSGVVGRAERTASIVERVESACAHRSDGRHVERFVAFERGQQTRKALRQHAFARARWPDQQDAVPTRRGHDEGAFAGRLTPHVSEIRSAVSRRGNQPGKVRSCIAAFGNAPRVPVEKRADT